MIVRIDSPGGSAIASEVIWQGLKRVGEKKPVWVSVGSMAASGGYYCLVAGDKVYVNPSSIVGSIGVVGGKMALGGVYDHLKLRIKERGIFRGDEKGDQLVVIKIIVPRGLDEDGRAMIEALQKKHPIDARADLRW